MNQQDYKEIAEIIKKFENDMEIVIQKFNKFGHSKEMDTLIKIRYELRDSLADYFEKKSTKCVCGDGIEKPDFNKEQFLKDCGVI